MHKKAVLAKMAQTVLTICLLANMGVVHAQDTHLPFSPISELPEILQKAKEQKKLIFMDGHTQWCRNCRVMEKEVFTDPAVAAFFETNFLNVEADMAKGAGETFAKKHNIRFFPALLFLDDAANIQHAVYGFCSPAELIAEGKRAMNPTQNLYGMTKRFQQGEKSPDFLKEYISVLRKANSPDMKRVSRLYVETTGLKERFDAGHRNRDFMDEYADVLQTAAIDNYLSVFAPEYLNLLSTEELATPRNWQWVQYYGILRYGGFIRKIAAQPEHFAQVAENPEETERVVNQALQQETFRYLRSMHSPDFAWDAQKFSSFLLDLQEINTVTAQECLYQLRTLDSLHKQNYDEVVNSLEQALTNNVFAKGINETYFMDFLQALASAPVNYPSKGVELINKCFEKDNRLMQNDEWLSLRKNLEKAAHNKPNKQ